MAKIPKQRILDKCRSQLILIWLLWSSTKALGDGLQLGELGIQGKCSSWKLPVPKTERRGKTRSSSSCVVAADALFRSIFNFPFYYCEQAFIVELKLNNKKNCAKACKTLKKVGFECAAICTLGCFFTFFKRKSGSALVHTRTAQNNKHGPKYYTRVTKNALTL